MGDHDGGYLPFEFEVSDHLQAGEANEVLVRVIVPDDDPQRYPEFPFSEIPHGKQSWYGPAGGIWQSVWLERRSPLHILAVRLLPDLQTGRVRAHLTLSMPASEPHQALFKLIDPSEINVAGARVAVPVGTKTLECSIATNNPLAWSPDRPNLYSLKIHLVRDGEVIDTTSQSLGFRTIEARAGQLFLNGEPFYLRGALDQDYYPDTICTPPSNAFLEDQIRKAKAMGFNCLRCHIKVPDPRYYEVADSLGMLVWAELPNWQLFTEKAAQRGRATLRGIVERDGHHPSIIAWTIVNEDWGTDLVHNASHRAWLRKTYQWLKKLDPARLVVDNSPCWPNFHVQTDLEDYHFYRAIPDHRCQWDEDIASFAMRPAWAFSPEGDAAPTGSEPLIVSEFGNWGLPDVNLLSDEDGRDPWWFGQRCEREETVAHPRGVRERFHTWHLDRVFGTWDDFVEATQWQQYDALKYEIESIRRHPQIVGFVVTELTDVHWECNGLLDMRRNPRVFCAQLAALNADTVILPEWERVSYWSGEQVKIGVAVAHGAGPTIEGACVHWTLTPGGASGRAAVPDLCASQVRSVSSASFSAPQATIPTRHRLDLELCAADGRQLATNHVELTIMPRRDVPVDLASSLWSPDPPLAERLIALGYRVASDPRAARVIVAHKLNGTLASLVREGKRLLLLADRLDAIGSNLPGVQVAAREGTPWSGDWVSSFAWLRRQGPFAHLPGGPLLDHSFDRVIPEHVLAGYGPQAFEAHVHAGLFTSWIHNPVALIIERFCGKGRVVLTTFRLTTEAPGVDPTATTLWDALVELTLRT